MAKVKTAISIQEDLLTEIDSIARKKRVPRSSLFERAVRDFLEVQKNRQMLQQLNAVYGKPPTAEEKRFLAAVSNEAKKLAEGE